MNKNATKKSQTNPPTPRETARELAAAMLAEEKRNQALANPTKIVDLDTIQAIFERRIFVDFTFSGNPYRVEMRRLKPNEDAALADIIDSIRCPIIAGATFAEERPDWANPEYVKAKHKAELEARAFGLYWCIDLYQKKKPGLTGAQVVQFVQSTFNETILQLFWDGIRDTGVEVAQLTNFTSAEPSVQS